MAKLNLATFFTLDDCVITFTALQRVVAGLRDKAAQRKLRAAVFAHNVALRQQHAESIAARHARQRQLRELSLDELARRVNRRDAA